MWSAAGLVSVQTNSKTTVGQRVVVALMFAVLAETPTAVVLLGFVARTGVRMLQSGESSVALIAHVHMVMVVVSVTVVVVVVALMVEVFLTVIIVVVAVVVSLPVVAEIATEATRKRAGPRQV